MKITGICLRWHLIPVTILCLLSLQPLCFGDLYRWKDSEGTVHITEDPSTIPPEHREQTSRRSISSDSQASISPRREPTTDGSEYGKKQIGTGLKYFEIPYLGYEGSARRIIIPVTLNESVTANLLLDTGAPGLVITPQLAERLGLLDPEEGGLIITAGGIGGTVPAILTAVDSIQVGDAYAEFLPATITQISSNHFEGLVGMDFLAGYRISIDTSRNVLAFEELPAQQNMPGGHDELWWRSNFYRIANMKETWQNYLKESERNTQVSTGGEQRKKMARHQLAEAEKIYSKLERFASKNAVPNHWRQRP